MRSMLQTVSQRVVDAMTSLGVTGDSQLRPAQDEKFGDYQCNAAMGIAKKLGRSPREVASELVKTLDIAGLCDPPEIAGPGFINFRLRADFVARELVRVPGPQSPDASRLGVSRTSNAQAVVVDLSSPNLAKEMHVGHLRSTVIGDCVARVLEFQGHNVIRENHVGDWGTQFGMLVAHLRSVRPDVAEKPDELEIADLEGFYVQAKVRFDADEAFRTESRETVVRLQRGDPLTRKIWEAFCHESLRHCHAICDRLGVRLVDRGESFYTELMDEVIRRLDVVQRTRGDGLVRESEGALCVFLDQFKTRDGETLPLIVRKTDGGFNYATSDLATILHRVETLGAKRILYVVGLSQKQHFEMLFAAARALGFVGPDVEMEHLGFGNVLAAGGRPFKTREGGTVKLKDLLDEAVVRARAVVEKPSDDEGRARSAFSEAEIARVAEVVGLGAVKYFDLSHSLQSDYKFDLDTILDLDGNTAPYMLYAYARVRSIGRKAGVDLDALPADQPFVLEHPAEIALAKKVLQLVDVIDSVGREFKTNVLTDYLYDLARTFSRFYDKRLGVRVIDAEPAAVRTSRLRLCELTARSLRLGLHLLGIETLEQM